MYYIFTVLTYNGLEYKIMNIKWPIRTLDLVLKYCFPYNVLYISLVSNRKPEKK